VLDHGGKECNGTANIDAVVCERNFTRLANGLKGVSEWDSALETGPWTDLQRRKVNDIVNVWVLLEHLVESSFIGNVALVKGWALAADELDAVDDFGR
jgi:hypothetical protein